uniref:Uncharacterized protein n=1 Tax=Arundo donax TaxID=35708 RepID=A0A0A9HDU8_ARUDO
MTRSEGVRWENKHGLEK